MLIKEYPILYLKRVRILFNESESSVDFVCNQGSQRYYIQSALRLPDEEKREQEVRSLKSISDCFRKFVITEDLISRYLDNDGITYMNIYEFLLDENSLRV